MDWTPKVASIVKNQALKTSLHERQTNQTPSLLVSTFQYVYLTVERKTRTCIPINYRLATQLTAQNAGANFIKLG